MALQRAARAALSRLRDAAARLRRVPAFRRDVRAGGGSGRAGHRARPGWRVLRLQVYALRRGDSPARVRTRRHDMSAVSEAIAKLSKTFTDQPEKARTKNAPATALLHDGLTFQVTGPAGEKILTDMPVPMGGTASAPNPGGLLRAALASCNAPTISMRAAPLGVTLETLEVTVDSDS